MISERQTTPDRKAADPFGRDRPSTIVLPGKPGATFSPPPEVPVGIPFWLKPIPVNTRDVEAVLRSYLTQTEPRLARFLVSTWNAQADDIKFDELRNAVRDHQFTVETWDRWQSDYINVVNEQFDPQWRAGIVAGADAISDDIAGVIGQLPRFDENADSIGRWIDTRGGEFITNMVDQQKLATTNIIRHMVTDRGAGPAELGKVLRPVVGLNRRQSIAVTTFMDALRSDGVSEDRVQARARTYSHRLQRQRATMIARTELASAFNYGQQNQIDQAVDGGDINAIVLKRFFTALDERVCPICGPLHGVAIVHDATFPSTLPRVNGGKGATTLTPPLHPQCRCTILWEIMGVEQTALPVLDDEGAIVETPVVIQPGAPTPIV